MYDHLTYMPVDLIWNRLSRRQLCPEGVHSPAGRRNGATSVPRGKGHFREENLHTGCCSGAKTFTRGPKITHNRTLSEPEGPK